MEERNTDRDKEKRVQKKAQGKTDIILRRGQSERKRKRKKAQKEMSMSRPRSNCSKIKYSSV